MEMTDKKISYSTLFVELFFYFSIIAREFGNQLGVLKYQGLSGTIIVLAGITCLMIMLLGHYKIPGVFFVGLAITGFIVFTALHVYGANFMEEYEIRSVFFWSFQMLMAYFILQNRATCYRFVIILSIIAFLAVSVAGGEMGEELVRLKLEGYAGAGASFANPNDLAYFTAIMTIASLFFSLRCAKLFKPVFWLISLTMAFLMLRTISRGALFFFGIGLIVFFVAGIFGHGGKISLILLILISLFAAGKVAYSLAETKLFFMERLYERTGREETWQAIPKDLMETLVLGRGFNNAQVTGTDIQPHNTFFMLHLAYGGPCAWIYAGWIIVLCTRILRMVFSSEYTINQKLEIIGIFIVSMGCQIMSNLGILNYAVVFGMAFVDRYTSCFSRKAILQRQYEYEIVCDEMYQQQAMSASEDYEQ
jgi:hypothetical protein